MAEGVGSVSCVYVNVGAEANIDQVAKELRKHGPIVLIVCCSDDDAAVKMDTALRQDPVDNQTRGDGGSVESAGDFQVTFRVSVYKHLIVAGRCPVVKELCIKDARGEWLIAELDFHVMVQGQLSIRVAAFARQDIRGGGEWDEVAEALGHYSVRLLAGEFGDTLSPCLATLRKRLAVKVAAVWTSIDEVQTSAMLVVGPVGPFRGMQIRGSGASSETRGGGVNVASLNSQCYNGEEGKGASRGWPVIQSVKQKGATTVLPHTRKLLLFLGSNTANRTPQAFEARREKTRTRAEKWPDRAWAQQFKPR